jgi:hypothetical protein
MNRKSAKANTLDIQGTSVAVVSSPQGDYISLTDMLHANDGEFATIKIQAGLNQRDHAKLEQLVVLTNLESLNAVFIRQGLPGPERLHKLSDIAITQMRSLLTDHNIKRLAS